MEADLRHEKTETLNERALRLAERIVGCIDIRFRGMLQKEKREIAEELEKRKLRGY